LNDGRKLQLIAENCKKPWQPFSFAFCCPRVQPASIRKHLAALKKDEADYDLKAKAQASQAYGKMCRAKNDHVAKHQ
jgi:hypothetical protein